MDAIQTKNVKVPNSLLVGGLIDDEVAIEVFDYLNYFQWHSLVPLKG